MHTGWHEFWHVVWDTTWGNNVAWLESLVILAVFTWLFRDYIGKYLAAWWARHHGPHEIEHHLEALRRWEKEKQEREHEAE